MHTLKEFMNRYVTHQEVFLYVPKGYKERFIEDLKEMGIDRFFNGDKIKSTKDIYDFMEINRKGELAILSAMIWVKTLERGSNSKALHIDYDKLVNGEIRSQSHQKTLILTINQL